MAISEGDKSHSTATARSGAPKDDLGRSIEGIVEAGDGPAAAAPPSALPESPSEGVSAPALPADIPAARAREAADAARIEELEGQLVERDLTQLSQVATSKIKRLESDLKALRASREAVDNKVLDLRARCKQTQAQVDEVRDTPEYRLGSLLLSAFKDGRAFLRLPWTLLAWRRRNLARAGARAGELVPYGNAPEYAHAVDTAIAKCDQLGIAAAEQWARDQRLRGSVLARVLVELAFHVRSSDPAAAVALAESAAEADPSEIRTKLVAFLMMDAGIVSEAAEALQAALAAGATLNGAEARRKEELFALSQLALHGAKLLSKRPGRSKPRAAKRAVLYVPQSLPYHWSSTAMRAHGAAQAIEAAGVEVDVVTAPGYPPRKGLDLDPVDAMQTVEGVVYHRMPLGEPLSEYGEEYAWRTGNALARIMRSLKATILIAPMDFAQAYPAAIACQATGADLILDVCRFAANQGEDVSERAALISKLERQLASRSVAVVARSGLLGTELTGALGNATRVIVVPESLPNFARDDRTKPWREEPVLTERTVIGYLGDAQDDLDLEALPDILDGLVKKGLDVSLAVFGVGTRFTRIRDRVEALGHETRALFGGRPRLNDLALAFDAVDIFVAPARSGAALPYTRSRYELADAMRHGKCVLATRAPDAVDALGDCAVYCDGGAEAFVETLARLVSDPTEWRAHAAAASRAAATMGANGLAQSLVAL